jgi:glutathione-regulated potassium-efflux system ancillary protein KefC/glutathione-regulated potassium-efflux system protein KefB
MNALEQSACLLVAAVLGVALTKRLGIGSVLGYLLAGGVVGPHALGLFHDPDSIIDLAEFGVVMLLFVIGLELKPRRLWVMRRQVFGLGGMQLALTAAAFALLGHAWLGLGWAGAAIAGFGLALSSTAFVLPILAEAEELSTAPGRAGFAILLFQDLAVIPALAIVPMLGPYAAKAGDGAPELTALKGLVVIAAVYLFGRYLLQSVLRWVAETRVHELFVATTLLVVVGTAALMEMAHLSMSLGAFLAGVLLADSDYRHELQADIEPFKGLLLGLFFMSVGMTANVGLLAAEPVGVLGLTAGFMLLKMALLYGVGRIGRLTDDGARVLAAALPQGGEFAFVLFGIAVEDAVMPRRSADLLILAVTLSMLLTPLLFLAHERWLRPRLRKAPPRPFDVIETDATPVVIAGFGRFGQIVARCLTARGVPFTAIDASADQVDFVRRFGNRVFYGDASRAEILHAARTGEAKLIVVAVDDPEVSMRTVEAVRRHFPDVPIFARARNRQHVFHLMDAGCAFVVRETYASSLELAKQALAALGLSPADAAETVERFRRHDEATLARQYAVHQDEDRMVQTAREAAAELKTLFEADAERRADGKGTT